MKEKENKFPKCGEEVLPTNAQTCRQMLIEIRKILADDALNDSECFWRIERLVSLFEAIGSDAGTRHDF